MNNKEKAVNLFKYIKELYAQRIQVITDVRQQIWHKFVHDIPDDEENIIFHYLDRTTEEYSEEGTETSVILQIRKPRFEPCPSIPPILNKWIENDWNDFRNPIAPTPQLVNYINGEELIEKFNDDEARVSLYRDWSKRRDAWVDRQRKLERTRNFFNELYYCYIDLQRDSETIEFMVGQGVLECKVDEETSTYHPLLLKRIALSFDSQQDIITISDADTNPEIYTMLLQEIDYINHSTVKGLKDDLAENFYHPLDRNDTPDYLTSFAHCLHSDSKYEENIQAAASGYDKVIIYNNPVFFIRKRTGGVLKALDDIIRQISETGELSGPLLNLLGENASQLVEPMEHLDVSQSLAAISGEDKDILFSKEANKEQLEIAKRIENYNAVLVQGPPGTGNYRKFLFMKRNISIYRYNWLM